MLWVLFVALAVASRASINSSTHLSNQIQNQHEQSTLSTKHDPSGQSFYYFTFPGDQFMDLNEQLSADKRARRMSAFMPMRGRKDGRSLAAIRPRSSLLDRSNANELSDSSAGFPDNLDGNIERLIGALLTMKTSNPKLGSHLTGRTSNQVFSGPLPEGSSLLGDLKPESFLASSLGSLQLESPDDSLLASKDSSLARFQRAFAPMRGKKFNLNSNLAERVDSTIE